MSYVHVVLYVLAAYLLFCKAWPYFLYPNYFWKSKIEQYLELRELAATLTDVDRLKTVENVYAYMRRTYSGYGEDRRVTSLLSVFEIGDFSTRSILHKKRFLWCHTQNRLFKSILVNTGKCSADEVKIKRLFLRSVYMHQWISIGLDGKTSTIDLFYGVFETRAN